MFISIESLIDCFAIVSVLYILFIMCFVKIKNMFSWILFGIIGGFCSFIGIICYISYTFFNFPIK